MDQAATIGRFAEGARRRRARRHVAAAVWSAVATMSLGAAVLSALSDHGRERIARLLETRETQIVKTDPEAEIAALHAEVSRLRDDTRMLSLEKEVLATKMGELETTVGPITASADRTSGSATPDLPRATYPRPPGDGVDVSYRSLPPLADADSAAPRDEAAIFAELGEHARIATPGLGTAGGPTAFAVELGSAADYEALTALWQSHADAHGDILAGLEPRVVIAARGGSVLKLRAGPIEGAVEAARTCAALREHGAVCTPVADDGETLDIGEAR